MPRFVSYLIVFAISVLTAHAGAVVGEQAPEFTLTGIDGNQYALEDYRGKYVVLEWINHDCPFVRKHYDTGNMQALQSTYTDKDVVWLSICSSAPRTQGHYEPEEHQQILSKKNAAPTALLLDESGDVGRAYGAKTTPHMYIIDPDGKLIYQGAIDDIPSTRSSDVPDAKNYVQLTLNASMNGKPIPRTSTRPYGCSIKYR